MPTNADILKHRDAIPAIAERNCASHVRIFGSMARGDERASSDPDLLVRFGPDCSLMDYEMLVKELQELIGIDIDVVSEGGIDQRFHDAVSKELVVL